MKRSTALIVLGVAVALGGVWWWALFGMRPEVGLAVLATSLVAVLAGCMDAGF